MKADLSEIVKPLLEKTLEICPEVTKDDLVIVMNQKSFGQGGYQLFGVDVIADRTVEIDKVYLMPKRDYLPFQDFKGE